MLSTRFALLQGHRVAITVSDFTISAATKTLFDFLWIFPRVPLPRQQVTLSTVSEV